MSGPPSLLKKKPHAFQCFETPNFVQHGKSLRPHHETLALRTSVSFSILFVDLFSEPEPHHFCLMNLSPGGVSMFSIRPERK
jgi:hypothetical protein